MAATEPVGDHRILKGRPIAPPILFCSELGDIY